MFDEIYTTPEGFQLHRPILLPDARAFSDVLEYIGEWDHKTMTHHAGELPAGHNRPEPRYVLPCGAGAAFVRDVADLAGLEPAPERNEIGPYCTIATPERSHRGVAVRATDAVLEVLAPRVVTPDDHLSFRVIVHEQNNRALIIAEHGYIIGSHWLAYVDPASLPAYPLEARDAAREGLYRRIAAATAWSPWRRDLPGGAADIGYDGWYPRGDTSGRLERRGELPRTRPVIVARVDTAGVVTYYPEGLEHLEALERAR